MDRVSSWYAKRTGYILFGLGLAAAIFLNVDAITIAKSLVVDRPLREAIVAEAEEYAKQNAASHAQYVAQHDNKKKPDKDAIKSEDDKPLTVPTPKADGAAEGQEPQDGAPPSPSTPKKDDIKIKSTNDAKKSEEPEATKKPAEKPDDTASAQSKSVGELRAEFKKLGFPIGWHFSRMWPYPAPLSTCEADGSGGYSCQPIGGSYAAMLGTATIGWFITAFAIMLGAPFWFDLLNKLISLRSAVRPPDNKTKGR